MTTLTAVAESKAPRVIVHNLLTGEEVAAQFNPEELEELISPTYDEMDTLGQSHRRMHYRNTSNLAFPLQLKFLARNPQELAEMRRARRHIHSWGLPRQVSNDIAGGGPPRLLVVWPQMLSVVCLLQSARIVSDMSNTTGAATRMSAVIELQEDRRSRIHFDDAELDLEGRLGG